MLLPKCVHNFLWEIHLRDLADTKYVKTILKLRPFFHSDPLILTEANPWLGRTPVS
jgi:hypothetical protein